MLPAPKGRRPVATGEAAQPRNPWRASPQNNLARRATAWYIVLHRPSPNPTGPSLIRPKTAPSSRQDVAVFDKILSRRRARNQAKREFESAEARDRHRRLASLWHSTGLSEGEAYRVVRNFFAEDDFNQALHCAKALHEYRHHFGPFPQDPLVNSLQRLALPPLAIEKAARHGLATQLLSVACLCTLTNAQLECSTDDAVALRATLSGFDQQEMLLLHTLLDSVADDAHFYRTLKLVLAKHCVEGQPPLSSQYLHYLMLTEPYLWTAIKTKERR